MENKKNERYNLEKYRSALFFVGLIIAFSLVITAFEWKTDIPKMDIQRVEHEEEFLNLDEIIPENRFIPERPKPKTTIVTKKLVTEEPAESFQPDAVVIKPEPEDFDDLMTGWKVVDTSVIDEPTDYTSEEASPVGGLSAFYSFLYGEIRYPDRARRLGITGRVTAEFTIGSDGVIRDVKIIKGIDKSCDQEVIRVLELAPDWYSEIRNGLPVSKVVCITVKFHTDM